jgi:hypothetical protein
VQGTKEDVQELYKVLTRADGKAVREDDAEPEVPDDNGQSRGDGELVLAMAVKEALLSKEEALAMTWYNAVSLLASSIELTEGRRYWEMGVVACCVLTAATCSCTGGWYTSTHAAARRGGGKKRGLEKARNAKAHQNPIANAEMP